MGLSRMSATNEVTNELLTDRTPKSESLARVAFNAMDHARIIRNLILLSDEKAKAKNKDLFDKNSAASAELMAFLAAHIAKSPPSYSPSTRTSTDDAWTSF